MSLLSKLNAKTENNMKYINADKLKDKLEWFLPETKKLLFKLIDELSEEKVVTDNSKVNTYSIK